jgi:hypothetical protein
MMPNTMALFTIIIVACFQYTINNTVTTLKNRRLNLSFLSTIIKLLLAADFHPRKQ